MLQDSEGREIGARILTYLLSPNYWIPAFAGMTLYAPSGVINNLDEGDPEIVCFKKVKGEQKLSEPGGTMPPPTP